MPSGPGFYRIDDSEPLILEGIEDREAELRGRFDPGPGDVEITLPPEALGTLLRMMLPPPLAFLIPFGDDDD